MNSLCRRDKVLTILILRESEEMELGAIHFACCGQLTLNEVLMALNDLEDAGVVVCDKETELYRLKERS